MRRVGDPENEHLYDMTYSVHAASALGGKKVPHPR